MKNCSVEGCKRPYRAKGYCNIHFRKWRRGELANKPRYATCHEEGCHKQLFRLGRCENHYKAWVLSKQGTSTAAAPEAPPAQASPEAPAKS